jgi:hypothetical protein
MQAGSQVCNDRIGLGIHACAQDKLLDPGHAACLAAIAATEGKLTTTANHRYNYPLSLSRKKKNYPHLAISNSQARRAGGVKNE